MAYELTDPEVDRVIHALDTAPHGSKGRVLEEWARRLSPDQDDPMSTQTLRRHIRQRRGKAKETSGRSKEIDRDLVLKIAQMKAKGMEAGLGDRELATAIAQEMAEREGLEGASKPHPSSINRILREELGFRQKKRYRSVEANFATQVFQFDFSRSKYLQVRDYDDEADDWIIEVSGKQLSYKDPEGAFRTWYGVLIDDHSRVRLARLFCATSESALLGLEFLRWAWTRPEDEHPMRHVPRKLQTDNGSFRRSKRVQNAFDSLNNVQLTSASKDAQGKVERSMRTLWQRFELPFAIEHGDSHQLHLSDLNDQLHEYCIEEASMSHPNQSRYTRSQVYRGSIMRTPPQTTSVDVVRLAFDVHTRKVDAYGRVSVDGTRYLCPETVEGIAIEPGMEVRVKLNAEGDAIGRLVERHHQEPFHLDPWEQPSYDEMGGAEHEGTGRTMQEKLRDQIDITTTLHTDVTDAPEVDVQDDSILAALGDRRIEVDVDSDFHEPKDTSYDEPSLTPDEARQYVGRRLQTIGQTYADARDIFDPYLAQETRITVDKLDTILQEYRRSVNQTA